ncbi:MAG: hypothetical protein A2Z42_01750, partial [Candidatus Woykebacteria bacterium RBG_19FT_COMBO_43_10]
MKIRGDPLSFRYSLRVKFSLITAAIFLIIFGIVSFVLIRQNIDFQKQSLLARANTFSNLGTKPIGDAYNSYFQAGFLRFREQLIDTLVLNEDIFRLQIISVEGEILFDTINLDRQNGETVEKMEDPEILQAVSARQPTQLTGQNGDVDEIIVPYSDDFGARPFSVRYFISYESIYKEVDRIILTIGLLTVAVLVVTLVAMTVFVYLLILKPLGRIIDAAGEITRGNLRQKIDLATRDELAELANSLNQMTERLKKNIEDLKQLDKLKNEFVYLASHNLRSPLTAIKGYIDILLKNKSLDREAKEASGKIAVSSARLEELTESLLNLVALEENKQPLLMKSVDLEELLEALAEKFAASISEKRISLIFEFSPGEIPKIDLDEPRISQALESLLENAIKFNREEGKIIVGLKRIKDYLRLSIKDTGIGIPKKERERVFQKFHRATDILTYDYEGIGLGLYVTKLIIEAHQGRIWFESEAGAGTTFYVELPLKEVD